MKMRLIEIRRSILHKNDSLAAALRARFADSGTLVVNLLSSPGSGKTTLLEESMRRLGDGMRVAALVGDQATENDAARLRRSGAPVRQIETGEECRLDADMVGKALEGWDGAAVDLLFIENVGNLICPAEYDLGEDLRVALFSVTEGEDKPLKYPLAFNTAHLVLVSKIDLADAVGFDRAAAIGAINSVHAGVPILEISSRTGTGFEAWLEILTDHVRRKQGAPVAV
jgi:hydrogenase nickel incorporation protein HypB